MTPLSTNDVMRFRRVIDRGQTRSYMDFMINRAVGTSIIPYMSIDEIFFNSSEIDNVKLK